MIKTKSCEWTIDQDLLLAEIALRHIYDDKKMENAWLEAAETFNRTKGACSFHWHGVLSKKYEQAIEQAKIQRKANKEKNASNGGKEVSGIILPKNRPINPMAEAMEKALQQTNHIQKDEQRTSNSENNEENHIKEEKSLENPFLRIRKFAAKMEREYGATFEENTQLKKEISFLRRQLEQSRTELRLATNAASDKQEQLNAIQEKLGEAHKQIAVYSEIKDLIIEFNQIQK